MTLKLRATVLFAAITCAVVAVHADGAQPGAQQPTLLMGTITYRERVALPPTAVVDVRLEDVTRPDAPAIVVARTRIEQPGQVPVRFNLDVDPSTVNAQGRYAVRATISDGATVLFTSMDTALVLTQGHGTRANLVLTRVTSPAPRPVPQETPAPPLPQNPLIDLPATFVGVLPCADCDGIRYHLNLFGDDAFFLRMTRLGKPESTNDDLGSWTLSSDRRIVALKGRADTVQWFDISTPGTLRKLDADGRPLTGKGSYELKRSAPFRPVDIRSRLQGAYTHTTSGDTFVECSTGQRWDVAGEGASRDLQNAYASAKPSPGGAVLVEISGLVTDRSKAAGSREGSVGPTLVAESLVRTIPRASCSTRFASAPLAETYWRLTNLGTRAIPPATDPRRQASITFLSDGVSFDGSSGCNRFAGVYSVSNATMTLKSNGTMVACKEEAKSEAAFATALQSTRTFRIVGRVLELFDAKGARIARFEAR